MSRMRRTLVLVNPFEFNLRCLRKDLPREQAERWRAVAAAYGDLAVWWASGDRLLATAVPPHPNLLAVADGGRIEVVCPGEQSSHGLCRDLLADAGALRHILDFAAWGPEPLVVTAWGATEGLYALLDWLGEHAGYQVKCDLVPRQNYWVSTQLDGKASLRALAAEAGLVMAPGWICQDLAEAAEVASARLALGEALVVKANLGVSGVGVYRLDPEEKTPPPARVLAKLSAHWARLPLVGNGPLVVEQAIGDPTGAVFANGRIGEDGVTVLGGGRELRDASNLYVGAILGGIPDACVAAPFVHLLEVAARAGFRGEIGADYLLDGQGVTRLLEVNPRRCSESHAYALARRAFGEGWSRGCGVALTRLPLRLTPGDYDVSRILSAFAACSRESQGEGEVWPGALHWLNLPQPGIGYVVLGLDQSAVRRVEARLQTRLRQAGLVLASHGGN